MMDMISQKNALRAQMMQRRKEMPFDIRAAADDAIAQQVLESRSFAKATWIFAYVSMPHEVYTRWLLGECLAKGKRLALPVCDTYAHTMQFYELCSMEELRSGAYRIPVPPTAIERRVIPNAASLMLVPMLAFDAQGYRLGAGGGYYDRYLAQYPIETMGLCYASGFVEALPHDSYDRRLQCCVTEQGTEVFHG
ncbi:MAG: 5-formyltetrahydrofolate cyclo-ligase [Oscillospiraceae bacterium]|nr:5-formyltetrahydrofolate cyclo-ligase [Oscillospiraceae bacterium]